MRPYGLTRREVGDDDFGGCQCFGRATHFLAPSFEPNRPRSMRGSKVKNSRRVYKKRLRHQLKRDLKVEFS